MLHGKSHVREPRSHRSPAASGCNVYLSYNYNMLRYQTNKPTGNWCGWAKGMDSGCSLSLCKRLYHKCTEISKRLNAIITQIVPFLSQEHQQQVLTAVERAKQITMSELNAVIGQQRPDLPRLLQQMHAQQIPGAHGAPPMPVGMPHPSLGPGALGGPLSALGSTPPQHPLAILNKQELHRPEESKSSNSNIMPLDDRHRSSISPTDRDKYRPRTPESSHELKKVKKEEKDMGHSDGEKSDQDLVVDDASEINPMSPMPNQHHNE
ncbi:hypothetical protein RP20_CCG008373 [Aedes albopictus]|nr:hypothetical protein RP20_CCG008373 [Aedes albopictus]